MPTKDWSDFVEKLSAKDRRKYERLAEKVFHQVAVQRVSDGEISVAGKTEKEARELILDHVGQLLKQKNIEFQITIDHTGDLLTRAREEYKRKRFELAALFYATYFEHTINRIIAGCARRRKTPDILIGQMIRDVNLRGKCSWLLFVFGVKPIAKRHAVRLNEVSDIRNGFVHYKWRPDNESLRKAQSTTLERVEKTVQYLKRFEDKEVYGGQRRHVAKAIKHKSGAT